MSVEMKEGLPPIENLERQQVKTPKPPKQPKMRPDAENRPQIKVFEKDGTPAKRKRPVDIDVSDKLLPPLTRGRTARYKLVKSWERGLADFQQDKKKIVDPATGLPPDPVDLVLPGIYPLFDPFDTDPIRRNKTMFNYGMVSKLVENEKGQNVLERELIDIEFKADYKSVDPDRNYLEYLFMELHPGNGSNKFRPNKNIKPIFMRVDLQTEKSQAYLIVESELGLEAAMSVHQITNRDKLIGISAAVPELAPTIGKLPTETLKHNLRTWAQSHPREFYAIYGNVLPAIKLNVVDAQSLGLIKYDPDTHWWINQETEEYLVAVSVGEDPLERICKTFKEDETKYKSMMDLLNYWEKQVV